MTAIPRDASRDRRIEVPSNLYLIHVAAHALLPLALRWRVSANAVSIAGLVVGALAALAFYHWRTPAMVWLGLGLAIGWMICDGLDGMVARATRTASALGRLLDGLCDHGVFALLYIAIASSLGTSQGWLLAVVAGGCHALQSSFYESERTRFHRRLRGEVGQASGARVGTLLERIYDASTGWLDRRAARFDAMLATADDRMSLGRTYADHAVAPMRAMIPLSANTRIAALAIACLIGDPRLWWWFEVGPLSLIAALGAIWHRRVERRLVEQLGTPAPPSEPLLQG